MLFWNNDYSRGLAGHMWPVTSVVRPASAQCCWLCYLSSDGLEESERHRSQKIYRSSEENRSKWVLFRIAMYRSSGYNIIFCPAVSAELPGVLMFWNPTDAGHKVACRACVRIPMYSGCKHRAPLWFTENIRLPMWVLSIAISIIDLNVHRWSTTKLMYVNRSHESWSVASDGLTKCIQAMVSLNTAQISLVEKRVSKLKMKLKITTNQSQNL